MQIPTHSNEHHRTDLDEIYLYLKMFQREKNTYSYIFSIILTYKKIFVLKKKKIFFLYLFKYKRKYICSKRFF